MLRAVRFIPAGGEVTDCYGEHYCTSDIETRAASLQQQYYFHCGCEACQQHWPTYFRLLEGCKLKCVKCHLPIDLNVGRCHKCNLDYLKVSKDKASDTVTYNWREILLQHELAVTEYEGAYKSVLEGTVSSDVIRKICYLIEFTDRYIHMPCKAYAEAQETLKRCFDHQSSFYLVKE